jgi:phosphatidylinositol alpha-1,6-mannosyltransferase
MRAADAYIMVSREGREIGDIEGFGITYLEASAAGLPVIAGNSGGTVDAVVDGVTGLVVDPVDPEAVGRAVTEIFKDRPRAVALGKAGQERVRRDFSLETRAARIVAIGDKG